MRVQPSLAKGIAALLGYLAVVFTVWAVTGVNYDEIGDSVTNVRNAVTLAIGAGAIYLVIVTTALGWWTPAMREAKRAGHAWMWLIPVLLLAGAFANLAATKWDRIDEVGPYVAWLAVGVALVGFSEELVTRGLLIVGGRGTLHEGWVWFVSSLCFGLLHVPNALFGQSVSTTVQQVVFAFVVGTSYYVTRRISGALVVTMVLHALWDFSTFIQPHSIEGMSNPPTSFGGFALYLSVPLAFVALWRILHTEGDVVEPGGDQLAPFAEASTTSA